MNILDIVKNRYTAKSYDSTRKLSEETIAQLQEVLQYSPSSINSQPWQFIFVSDEKIKSQLADKSMINSQRIKEASHLVIFCSFGDLDKFETQLDEIMPKEWAAFYYNVVKSKGDEVAKAWLNNQVYLSLGFFLMACAEMGIDSTPMEGIFPEEYDKILNIENGYKTLFAVAIGYRNPEDKNQPSVTPKQRLPLEKIIKNY